MSAAAPAPPEPSAVIPRVDRNRSESAHNPLRRFRQRLAAESLALSAIAWIAAFQFLHWSIEAASSDPFSSELAIHLTACVSSLIAAITARIAHRRYHDDQSDGGVVTSGIGLPGNTLWKVTVLTSWVVPMALFAAVASVVVVVLELEFHRATAADSTRARLLISLGLRAATETLFVACLTPLLSRLPWRGLATPLLGGAVVAIWRGHHLFPLTSSASGIDASGAPPAADERLRFLLQGELPITAGLLAIGVVAAWLACSGAPEPPRHRSAAER